MKVRIGSGGKSGNLGELQSQKGIREIAGLEKYMGGSVGKCKNIDFLRVRFLGCAFHGCKGMAFFYMAAE